MNYLRAVLLTAFLTLIPFAQAGFAEDVTLTSRDGAVEITGTLLTYDGEFYRVETDFGILTVDGSGVNCDGPACPSLGDYVAEFAFSGAADMGSVLIPAMIEGFALRQSYALKREDLPGIGLLYTLYEDGSREAARITVRQTSSAEGFADLISDQADIVMSLREVSPQERELGREAGLGDLAGTRQGRVLALDALVPVVSPGNPVTRLSVADLGAVFSGDLTRWSDLGGEDAPITLYMQDPDFGFGHVFVNRVMSAQGRSLSPAVVYLATTGAVARAVADDPFGIGIASFSGPDTAEPVTLTGDCRFDLTASTGSIRAGDYPLAAPMYLYLPARRLPKLARDLLAYMRSDAAQVVTRRAGFVDQTMGTVPVADQGLRLSNAIRAAGPEVPLSELQRMMALFTDRDRLTLSFRFEGGSAALDAPSRSNVALLAAALEAGRFDGQSLTFVGFSDGQGEAATNLALARRRANAVRDAVLAEIEAFDSARVTIKTDGFGEALPMACDDSAWGRQVNRRVELWIQPSGK